MIRNSNSKRIRSRAMLDDTCGNRPPITLPPNKSREKGTILIVTLFVTCALIILAVPSLFKLLSYYSLTEKSHKSLAAIHLAEAGIERAIWELNYGDILTWAGTSQTRSFAIESFQPYAGGGDGDIDVVVVDPSGQNPVIESVGRIAYQPPRRIEKKVRVVLEEREIPFFDYGVFGNDSVTIASNLLIQGDVGTNGTSFGAISIDSNSTVAGDVTCGPEGDPEIALQVVETASVTGTQRAAGELKDFPSVTAPEGLPYRGSVDVKSGTLTISEDGEYTSLLVDQNSMFYIDGDVTLHVTSEFRLGSNTELIIQEGGSLTLYMSGSIDMDSNCIVTNAGQDPTKLKFYGTDDLTGTVQFDSNAAFYGAIYMPNADLVISSNIDLYGAVYGKTVELNANVYLSYQEGQTDFSDIRYWIKSWQEILN